MEMNKMVTLYNDYPSSVGYTTERGVSKIFPIGSSKRISVEELLEVVNSIGGRTLLVDNILLVKESDVREFLGLSPLDEYNPDSNKIKELFQTVTNDEFEEILQYCSNTTLEKIVTLAVNTSLGDLTKIGLIKKYSGKDISEIIKENMEADKTTAPSIDNKPIKRTPRKPKE